MLQHSARRRVRSPLSRHIAAASLEQLRLPWLCAAPINGVENRRCLILTRPHTRLARPLNPLPDASKSPSISTKISTRHISIDTGTPTHFSDPIPFQGLPPGLAPQPRSPSPWDFPPLKHYDADNLIQLTGYPHLSAPVVKRSNSGLIGDTGVLLENLYALLKVGRLDQAAKVIRNLGSIFQPDAPELLDAHARYLVSQLNRLLSEPTKEKFDNMHRWFELEIRGKKIVPDSGILATMIKASFAALNRSALDRAVRAFVHMAEGIGPDVKDDLLSSQLLSEDEYSQVLRLFPNEFEAPPQSIIEHLELPASSAKTLSDQPSNDLTADASHKTASIPELNPVEQKGLGLKALKRSLVSMDLKQEAEEASALYDTDMSTVDPDAYERQKKLERAVVESALERWREESESTQAMRAKGQIIDPLLGSFAFDWIQEMVPLVKEEIRFFESGKETPGSVKDADRKLLGPFLKIVSPDKLCAVAVLTYISHITDTKNNESAERSVATTVARIGTDIAKEIEHERAQNNLLQTTDTLPSTARKQKLLKLSRTRKQKQMSKSKAMSTIFERDLPPASREDALNLDLRIRLGALFLSFLTKIAKLPITKIDPETGKKITQDQPIITHAWKWRAGKRIGVIRANPDFLKRLSREPVGSFIAKHLPMIVHPRRWKNLHEGPFLETHLPAVRFRDTSRSQQEYIAMATKRGDMNQTYAALDVIGKVPWRVNKDVFKVLTEAWNSGEAIGGLAPENPPDNWPEKPPASDIKAIMRWKQLVKTHQNMLTGLHSQRCYQNFQLEVARSYLNETFYCPHNVDFRGRAYPIPPYFNHMGADYVRGLFAFAEGKPLGEHGLRWLKIHLSSVYGYDKASLDNRELFTTEHLEDIRDSATDPLGGRRWWLTSDDPWQTLAACIELINALDSPDPEQFVSHIPVQQDGTCNGLQHYAALGGDVDGAKQVNLMPADRPADIYSGVADMVKKNISEAAARGEKAAQILDGKITRKVVKQPVMTNVYGVTFHGAAEQVKKQLIDILPKESLDNDIHLGALSKYTAVHIFKALSRMFNGAHAIQSWLGECGARISSAITPEQIERIKARRAGTLEPVTKLKRKRLRAEERAVSREDYQFKSTIVWTTPMGMPVVQPYREPKLKKIRTSLQDIAVLDATISDPVSKRKQLQGFPPNFIHSLDATHMMLSALKCDELGLQFSSVHDSFWTHASDVPTMNRVLREAFVRMHSEDVIGRLREEFVARYKGCMRWAPIDAKSPLGQKIISFRKSNGVHPGSFTSSNVKEGAQIDELLEEYDRLRLLRSDDPEDQMKGREMVTPASLFDAETQANSFLSRSNDDLQLLGQQQGNEPDISEEADSDEIDVPGITTPQPLHEDVPASIEVPNKDAEAEAQPSTRTQKPKKRPTPKVYLWLPMDFPAQPEKGKFDVQSLKDSQYFFS